MDTETEIRELRERITALENYIAALEVKATTIFQKLSSHPILKSLLKGL